MDRITPSKPQLYRVPRDIHTRAAAEAQRRCKATGRPVTWQDIMRESLSKNLPK